jgi:HSP20 family molecular chaperone IbpA
MKPLDIQDKVDYIHPQQGGTNPMVIDFLDNFFKTNHLGLLNQTFPKYTILQGAKTMILSFAVAGYQKSDLSVSFTEEGVLTVESQNGATRPVGDMLSEPLFAYGKLGNYNLYGYDNIPTKPFKLNLYVGEDLEVSGAELRNGILEVTMKMIPTSEDENSVPTKVEIK